MDPNKRAALLLHLARRGAPDRPRAVEAWRVLSGSLRDLEGRVDPRVARRLIDLRRRGEPDRELARATARRIRLVFPGEDGFPEPLSDHPMGPPLLYIAGSVPGPPRVAIVGARDCSPGMARFARELGRAAARAGLPVVSGLAYGIDAAAHAGCLDAGGTPVGVLGTGVDQAYPIENRALHRRVAEAGALVSTFPIGFGPRRHHFPGRNRLVASLSSVVCVVEAGERSGALSTAACALSCDTEVVAVPGAVLDPRAAGTNRLIRDGARPILAPEDLVEAVLGVGAAPPERTEPPDDPLLAAIARRARTPEEIAAELGIDLESVRERIVWLELEGRVETLPGRRFRYRP